MNSLDWKLVCKVCIITYTKNKPERLLLSFASLFFIEVGQTNNYFLLLCLFFLSLFLRLCVDILCLFLFFPLGILLKIYRVNTNVNLFLY